MPVPPGWVRSKRGRSWQHFRNPDKPQQRFGQFWTGPRFVKHHVTKEFVEFEYVVNPDFASQPYCRAFAQNSHVAVEFYDDYIMIFDPDYERRICRETWTPQVKIGDNWETIETVIVSRQKEDLPDGVRFSENKDCLYLGSKVGELEISLIIRSGRFLKHEIKLTNLTAQTRTIRIVQTLIGIAGKRVVHALGEEDVTITEQERISRFIRFVDKNNPKLQYLDENLMSLGHLGDPPNEMEWINDYIRAIRFKLVDYEGQKLVRCDIVIGNYTLAQNESLLIDPATSTWTVAASGDDVTRYSGTNQFSSTSIHCSVGNYISSQYLYQGSCARFLNVGIPQGATINSAVLLLIPSLSNAETVCNCYIHGEDVDDATQITSASDWDGRTRTTANVDWSNIASWTAGSQITSPDFANVVQEIVNRPGWASGNAMNIFWSDFEDQRSDTDARRIAASYDHTTYDPPQLEVTWTVPPYKLPQNLSVLSHRPMIRRVGLKRGFLENLSIVKDVFSFIYTPVVKVYQFVQNLSAIAASFSFIHTPLVKVYQFVQNLSVISDILTRRTSYLRSLVETPLLRDAFKRVVNYIRAFVFKVEQFEDDFNDNVIDLTKWDTIQVNTGTVAEANNRLEVSGAAVTGWAISGLVSKKPYDLTQCGISVDVVEFDSLESMRLFVNLTKTTTSDPYQQNNWYLIEKNSGDSSLRIRKKVGGVLQPYLYYGPWKGATGSLMIAISDGVISFYENGEFLVSEPYGLPSYNAYIYTDQASSSPYSGTDAFDNFKAAITKKPFPPTIIVRDAFSWHPRLWIRQLIMNLSTISSLFIRRIGYRRSLRQNLSVLKDVFTWHPRQWIRQFVQNLSVIRDVFTFVHTVVIPVYQLVQNLSVITDVPKRIVAYTRRQAQQVLIEDIFKRLIGFPRKFIQDLSVLKAVFARKTSYSRRIVNETLIQDVFNRFAGFPRKFVENLSVLKDVFVRKLAYLRILCQNLSVIQDVFSFIRVPLLRIYQFIQNLSVLSDVFTRRASYIRKLANVTTIQDIFQRVKGIPRRFVEDLSILRDIFARRVAQLRRLRQDLSVIRDVFTFVYVPIVKIYQLAQTIFIQALLTRRSSYIRKFINATRIQDVFKRVIGFPRRLTQNLSVLRTLLTRRLTYTREIANLTLISAVLKRVTGLPRKFIENLSILQDVFTRRVPYIRKLRQNLSVIQDVFSFIRVPLLKLYQLVQNLSVITDLFTRRVSYIRKFTNMATISHIFQRIVGISRRLAQDLSVISIRFVRRVSYLRKLIQTILIRDVFSFIYTAFVRIYRLAQTIVISLLFKRRVSYTRKLRQDLSVLQDIFTSIYTALVRIYRFAQNLSVIAAVFSYQLITPAIEVIRRKLTTVQAEIQDLYEKVKKKAKFYLGK